jgi:cyclopropane-fatty-acyl-phospholipid synthase
MTAAFGEGLPGLRGAGQEKGWEAEGRAGALDRWLLARLAKALEGVPIRLALWDGTERLAAPEPPVARVRFRNRRALFAVLRDPEFAFGEAYASGNLTVEGDLVAALVGIDRVVDAPRRGGRRRPRPRNHGLGAARENVHHHYNLGNDFYRLWLDEEMLYTCAYFPRPDDSLEVAQRAKMDHVCRKLGLKPGDRVVEAGCGWGALALHMARAYGATVTAFNISREQIQHARRRAAEDGLADRVEFREDDYRAIRGRFDAFVSVGMVEHVGLENYRTLGEVINRSLEPQGGRGLLHFIGRNRPAPLNAWIERRIFPGAYPPSLTEVVDGVLAPFDFSVLDVENLRLHYARTIEHWRRRLEAAAETVAATFGLPFLRAWRLYLAGSEAAFRSGSMQLFQIAFARGAMNEIPWTRAHLYPDPVP